MSNLLILGIALPPASVYVPFQARAVMPYVSESFPSSAAGQGANSPPQRPAIVISPLQALQNMVNRKISGRLTVRETVDEPVCWRIYTGKGFLHFADSLAGQRERLSYLLQRSNFDLAVDLAANLVTDSATPHLPPLAGSTYEYLYKTWQGTDTHLSKLRRLLYFLSQEALIWILTMPKATLQFDRNVGLDPVLLSVPFQDSVAPLVPRIKAWHQLRPHLTSPFQRLYLVDAKRFVQQFDKILRLMRGAKAKMVPLEALERQPCLYELAAQLDVDLLTLGKVVAELVRLQIVTLHPYDAVLSQIRPTIACIDDSITVQRKVKLILEAEGYQVLGLTDPLRALSSLVHSPPGLILMDIAMPYIDGYELCRMLRQCAALKQTPIVMLTGRDGLVDRVRARLVGTVNYITKPFDAKTLTDVVEKVIHVEEIRS
jgi:twitching motility two-component system response regulator PilG